MIIIYLDLWLIFQTSPNLFPLRFVSKKKTLNTFQWCATNNHFMYDDVIVLSPFLSIPLKEKWGERKNIKDSTKGDALWLINSCCKESCELKHGKVMKVATTTTLWLSLCVRSFGANFFGMRIFGVYNSNPTVLACVIWILVNVVIYKK